MRLSVQSRNGRSLGELDVDAGATVDALMSAFYRKNRKYYPSRQRFTIGHAKGTALEKGTALSSYDLHDGDKLIFKDLGPQFGYRAVYIIEYLGPFLLYPVFFMRPSILYGPGLSPPALELFPISVSNVPAWAFVCFEFHFAKRVLESMFLHKFTNDTMPLPNLFRNCGHYYFGAVAIGFFVNHPKYQGPFNDHLVIAGLFLFWVGELGNFYSHLLLAKLRAEGVRERKIPHGFMFELVSFPNYYFEVQLWFGFCLMTQALTSYMFLLFSAGTMMVWAMQKHRRYRKMWDGKDGRKLYPRHRKIMYPFIW